MPRRRLTLTTEAAYHVMSRSNNRDWFYLPLHDCWEIFCHYLHETTSRYEIEVYAFTLMSNHFHCILRTRQKNVGEVMRHLLTGVSKTVQVRAKRINHVFGSRYKWTLLWNPTSFAYVYKYVLRNPIRAGICNTAQTYPFNSLRLIQPFVPTAYRIDREGSKIPRSRERMLDWLNLPVDCRLESVITRALKRESFAFSKKNEKQREIRSLKAAYGIPEEDDRYFGGPQGD